MPNLQVRPNCEKNLRNSALHLYKVSPNSPTHENQKFFKGVWWISLYLIISLLLMTVLDVTYNIVLNFAILQETWMSRKSLSVYKTSPQRPPAAHSIYWRNDTSRQTDGYLGMDVSGGSRQVRWKARGQPSQQISSPPSLHTAHSSSL